MSPIGGETGHEHKRLVEKREQFFAYILTEQVVRASEKNFHNRQNLIYLSIQEKHRFSINREPVSIHLLQFFFRLSFKNHHSGQTIESMSDIKKRVEWW